MISLQVVLRFVIRCMTQKWSTCGKSTQTNTMDVIIDQPENELLFSFKDRLCEEITELQMLRDADQVIIKEKSHSLGKGKRYLVTDRLNLGTYYEITQDTPCQFSLREINDQRSIVLFSLPTRTSCICPCGETCTSKSKTFLRPDTCLGFVQQSLTWCQPFFNVYNGSGEWILGIDGSFAMMFFSIGRHRVIDSNGFPVGDILINYSTSGGLHDVFLKFPKDMHISTKLTLFGAGLMFSNGQANRV